MNTDCLCLVYRRAIELCFVLINDSNVKSLTKEIVSFCPTQARSLIKASIASNLFLAAER